MQKVKKREKEREKEGEGERERYIFVLMAFFVQVSGTIRDNINPVEVNFPFSWNQRASHFMISKVVPFFRSHSPVYYLTFESDVINTPLVFFRAIVLENERDWFLASDKCSDKNTSSNIFCHYWNIDGSHEALFSVGFIFAFVIITIWTKRNVLRVILVRNKQLLNNQLANERLID